VTVSPIQITRYSDTASPIISLQAAQGTVIPTATLMLLRHTGDRTVYALKITLTDVLVTQVSTASPQGDVPVEKISLSFAQIKWEYTRMTGGQGAGALIVISYDVAQKQVLCSSAFSDEFAYSSSGVSPIDGDTPFSSLALQLTNSATGGGTGTGSGTAAISPATLVVPVFEDTFGEFCSALKGTIVSTVTAHYLTVGGDMQPFDRLRYQMTNAQVVSVAIDTTSTGSLQETLGFDFTKIKWTATSVTAGQGGGQVVEAEWPPTKTDH